MTPKILGALLLAPWLALAEPEGFSAGLQFEPKADAATIGLPVYPGALPRQDAGDTADGARFALWGGRFGLRLAVQKLAAGDPIDRVAAFYREALGRRGEVLDCSPPQPRPPKPAASGPKVLACDESRAEPGARIFKAGTAGHFRVVSLKPVGAGVHIDVARVDIDD